MIPISKFISIQPLPASDKTQSGLFTNKKEHAGTAIVLGVSKDIKTPEIKPGDKIVYIESRSKFLEGQYLVSIEMVLSKI